MRLRFFLNHIHIYPISNILIMVATFFCPSALCCKVCNHKHKDQVPCSRPCTYFNWANFGHQFLTFYSTFSRSCKHLTIFWNSCFDNGLTSFDKFVLKGNNLLEVLCQLKSFHNKNSVFFCL